MCLALIDSSVYLVKFLIRANEKISVLNSEEADSEAFNSRLLSALHCSALISAVTQGPYQIDYRPRK